LAEGFELVDVFRGHPRRRNPTPGEHVFRPTFTPDPVYLHYRGKVKDPVDTACEILEERYEDPFSLFDGFRDSALDAVVPAMPFRFKGGRPFVEPEHCDVGFGTHGKVSVAVAKALAEADAIDPDLVHATAARACAPLLHCLGYRGDWLEVLDEVADVLDAPTSRELRLEDRRAIGFCFREPLGLAPEKRFGAELFVVEAFGEAEVVAAEFEEWGVLFHTDTAFVGLGVVTEEGPVPADPEDILDLSEEAGVKVGVMGPFDPSEGPYLRDRSRLYRSGEWAGEVGEPAEVTGWAGLYRWNGWWKGRRFTAVRDVPFSLSRFVWLLRRIDLSMVPETVTEEFDVEVWPTNPGTVWFDGDLEEVFEAACATALSLAFAMCLNPPVESSDPSLVMFWVEDVVTTSGTSAPVEWTLERTDAGASVSSSGDPNPVRGISIEADGVAINVDWLEAALLPWWMTSLSKIGDDLVGKLVKEPGFAETEEFEREYVRTALASERKALKLFRKLVRKKGEEFSSSILKLANLDLGLRFEVLEWLADMLR